jgi:hypothetical protein
MHRKRGESCNVHAFLDAIGVFNTVQLCVKEEQKSLIGCLCVSSMIRQIVCFVLLPANFCRNWIQFPGTFLLEWCGGIQRGYRGLFIPQS